MKRFSVMALLVVAFVLAACNVIGLDPDAGTGTPGDLMTPAQPPTDPVQPTADTGQPATVPVQPTAEPVETAEPVPTEDSSAGVENCPVAGEGQLQYVSEEWGFCFVYPDIFEAHEDFSWFDEVNLAGPPLDPTQMEPMLVTLQVEMTGPAVYVTNGAEYSQMWADLGGEGSGEPAGEMTIGGQQAAIRRNIPGMASGRAAFVVANGIKYRLDLQPQPEDVGTIGDLAAQGEMVWQTVTSSIVFFPPVGGEPPVTAEDVCPQPTEGMTQLVSLADGLCFLYPSELERDDLFTATGITGGPTVEVPNFGPMRARMVPALFGPAEGMTPAELLETWVDAGLDPSSFEETTIGGAPAITYFDNRGPVGQIGAHIVADDRIYTMVANPYDHTLYPEQSAVVDQMWPAALESLAFFDPWR